MPARRSLEESYRRKADERGPDDCWPWRGTRNHKGYGYIARRRADGSGKAKYFKVTHVSWEIANGLPFPADKIACHSCDNPSCVNPAHIWPGTHADNAADKMAKGRHASVPCGHSRLDDPIHSDGQRRCRECKRQYDRANYARKLAYKRQRRRVARELALAGLTPTVRTGEIDMIVQAITIRREGYCGSYGYSSRYNEADGSKPFLASIEVHGRSGKTELQLSADMSAKIVAIIADEIAASGRATADAMTAEIFETAALPAPKSA